MSEIVTIRSQIAHLSKKKKYTLFENVNLENRESYFALSCLPITKVSEDDMELLSDIVTWGELYTHSFDAGIYVCARCNHPLYSNLDKWKGPCVWPSFRKPIDKDSLYTIEVLGYNNYTCAVQEVYCGKCKLFIGHQFEDGIAKGDAHPEARWRQ